MTSLKLSSLAIHASASLTRFSFLLPSFKTITESDINHVKTALTENPTNTSTDLMHILAQKRTRASNSTVQKVIDAAGFTATAPRYGQMVRNVKKVDIYGSLSLPHPMLHRFLSLLTF
jgi:hypothetical protein